MRLAFRRLLDDTLELIEARVLQTAPVMEEKILGPGRELLRESSFGTVGFVLKKPPEGSRAGCFGFGDGETIAGR